VPARRPPSRRCAVARTAHVAELVELGVDASRMAPPSRAAAGGSSTSVVASASRRSVRSSSSPSTLRMSGACSSLVTARTRGNRGNRLAQGDQVRGPAVPARPARPGARRRARSSGRPAACRGPVILKASSSTASRRSCQAAPGGRAAAGATPGRACRPSASASGRPARARTRAGHPRVPPRRPGA